MIGYKGDQQDLLIRQGASFRAVLSLQVNGQPLDVSGLTFRSQIRKTFDATEITATILCTILDPVTGQLELYISDEDTQIIVAGVDETDQASLYVWDLEAEDAAGDVYPYLYGDVTVFREVTR